MRTALVKNSLENKEMTRKLIDMLKIKQQELPPIRLLIIRPKFNTLKLLVLSLIHISEPTRPY